MKAPDKIQEICSIIMALIVKSEAKGANNVSALKNFLAEGSWIDEITIEN